MTNNDNYYNNIIGKINHLIAENHWDQAMIVVKNELEMPYIPNQYQTYLQEVHCQIINHVKSNTKFKIHQWNLEEISQVLIDSTDEEIHLVAFHYLQNHNVRLILPVIKNYFINNNFSNVNKTRLLFLLKEQGINQEFQVVKTHGTFMINPSILIQRYDLSLYQSIAKLFENKVHIDNPGIYHICIFLLDSYIENLIPALPDNKYASPLAASLYIRACQMQFINVSLSSCAKIFKTSTKLIKKFITNISEHKII